MDWNKLPKISAELGAALRNRGWRMATAESCTGGGIAEALTAIAGSSDYFDRGFVTYSNESKQELLGVPAEVIAAHGAVSEETVRAMAEGALAHSRAHITVSVSGVAGPGGGSERNPVGTVCFGWALEGGLAQSERLHFEGDREAVRRQSVMHALLGTLDRIRSHA